MSFFHDNEDEIIYGTRQSYAGHHGYVECNRCGKGGLSWEDTDEGWILVNAHTREVHRCASKMPSDDDFSAVT